MKRNTLVAGANRGIGLAIARRLAELGHSVLLGSCDPSAVEAAAAPLRRLGLDVTPIHLDLTVAATVDSALDDIRRPAAPCTCWSTTPGSYTMGRCSN